MGGACIEVLVILYKFSVKLLWFNADGYGFMLHFK